MAIPKNAWIQFLHAGFPHLFPADPTIGGKLSQKGKILPNLKIYVEEAVWAEQTDRLLAALPPLREMLCREFSVDSSLCQLAILPVRGLPDQAQVSVEIQILPKPDRTRELIWSVCSQLRSQLKEVTGTLTAVRATALDPATYIALR